MGGATLAASTAMSHADHPPQLPDIRDEAGETPRWVPYFGLALFALIVAYVWWAHHQRATAATEGGDAPAVVGAAAQAR